MRASGSSWKAVGQSAALFACCVGIGRFVYTPVLPLMILQAGLTREQSALIATANFAGYLAGAVIGFVAPLLLRSPLANRICLSLLVVTLSVMPATTNVDVWMVVRFLAGVFTAIIFMFTVSSTLANFRGLPTYLTGWAFGGVGAGIALSATVILALSNIPNWRMEWWASALLALALSGLGWNLRPATEDATASTKTARPVSGKVFLVLLVSYSLEGVGYIVAGSFLIAAVSQTLPLRISGGVWVVVGLAALPSAALWGRLGSRFSLSTLLIASLCAQASGIAVFPVFGGVAAAALSAVLFGATFVAISTIALGIGAELNFPKSVAVLTAGYSLGQILGPLAVAPLLSHGYNGALIAGAITVGAAACAAYVLHVGLRKNRASSQIQSTSS